MQYVHGELATTTQRAGRRMDIAIVRRTGADRRADLFSPTEREIDSSFRKQILAATAGTAWLVRLPNPPRTPADVTICIVM